MEGDAGGVEPERLGAQHELDGHGRGAAEFARERPLRAHIVHQHAAADARAGRRDGDLIELGLRVEGEEAHALVEGMGDVGLLLDRVAVGDPCGIDAEREAEIDLAPARRVEIGAEPVEQLEYLGRRVRFEGIIDLRRLERPADGEIALLDDVEVHHETGRARLHLVEEGGDLGRDVAARSLRLHHAKARRRPLARLRTRAQRLGGRRDYGSRVRRHRGDARVGRDVVGIFVSATTGGRAALMGYEHRLLPLGSGVFRPGLPKETRPSLHNHRGPAARAYASISGYRAFSPGARIIFPHGDFFCDFYDKRLAPIVQGAAPRGRLVPTASFPRAHEM